MPNLHDDSSPVPLIALVGPTAVGKTELSLRLAAHFPLEVVNADSRQVYLHMDIGTGKPTPEERALVPHHVFDVAAPDSDFSLADYLRHARQALSEIEARGHVPLLVGGSGQYVWSLVEGWDVPQVPPDGAFRRAMELRAATEGHLSIHDELARIDPDAALRIQATNVRRVIRALELHRATGERPSILLTRRIAMPPRVVVVGLSLDRPCLFARVDVRIDTMMRRGFLEEVRALLSMGYSPSLPAMSSIGYREMAELAAGTIDADEAVLRVRRETRRLVRKQHTWFRPEDDRIRWVDMQETDSAFRRAVEIIQGVLK